MNTDQDRDDIPENPELDAGLHAESRSIPSVNRRNNPAVERATRLAVLAVAFVVGGVALYLYVPQLTGKRNRGAPEKVIGPPDEKPAQEAGEPIDERSPTAVKAQLDAELAARRKRQQEDAPQPPPLPQQGATAVAGGPTTEAQARRLNSPLIAIATTKTETPVPAENDRASDRNDAMGRLADALAESKQPRARNAPSNAADGDASGLGGKLPATTVVKVSAETLPNRDLLMTQGTFIDCTLETALDSTVPGFSRCVTTRNVYANSGRVILFERGTKIVGQYRGGIMHGQARIFVQWTRAETPRGVVIALDSPGTDPLGAAGLPGFVDSHFWERFGGSLMLSIISDSFDVLKSEVANTTVATNSGNTQDSLEDAASIALENSINIPPTLYKNQGDKINIIIARDLDFSTVYALRLADTRN